MLNSEPILIKDCYIKLERLETFYFSNPSPSILQHSFIDQTVNDALIKKFLDSQKDFIGESQQFKAFINNKQIDKDESHKNQTNLKNKEKLQKLHICHICFKSYNLNCDLRDHVFFAHTAHPTLQETLKVNIVGTEAPIKSQDDFIEDYQTLVRKSVRKRHKNRKYADYDIEDFDISHNNNILSNIIIKKEPIFYSHNDNPCIETHFDQLFDLKSINVNQENHNTFSQNISSQINNDMNDNITLIIPKIEAENDVENQNTSNNNKVCNICGKVFAKRLLLRRHFDSVHLRLRPHLCFECGEKFASKDTLAQHIRTIHEKSRPFLCTLCPGIGKAFTRKQCLTTHIRVAHRDLILNQNNPDIEVIIIDKFSEDPLISQDFLTNNNDEGKMDDIDFVTGIINEPFKMNEDINKNQIKQEHLSMSIGKKKGAKIRLKYYRCHFCGKIFNQEAHLSRHIKSVHQRLKPYKCYLCPKIPPNPALAYDEQLTGSSANISIRDHYERDPSTGHWIKSFSRKEFLIKHIRSVHQGYRAYSCDLCGMKYCDKRDMENHKKKAHSIDSKHLRLQNLGNDTQTPIPRACPYPACSNIVFTSKIHLSKHVKTFHSSSSNIKSYNLGLDEGNKMATPIDKSSALTNRGMDDMNVNNYYGSLMNQDETTPFEDSASFLEDIPNSLPLNIHSPIPLQLKMSSISQLDSIPYPSSQLTDGMLVTDNSLVSPNSLCFACDTCDKLFTNRASLVRHFKSVHENHRAYACRICGRSFNQRPHLERHLASLIHADVLKYACDYCGRRFALKSRLEKHLFDLNYHRDPNYVRVPKYVCYICTPPQALAIGDELDFVPDDSPFSALLADLKKKKAQQGILLTNNDFDHKNFEDFNGQNVKYNFDNDIDYLDESSPKSRRGTGEDKLLASLTSKLISDTLQIQGLDLLIENINNSPPDDQLLINHSGGSDQLIDHHLIQSDQSDPSSDQLLMMDQSPNNNNQQLMVQLDQSEERQIEQDEEELAGYDQEMALMKRQRFDMSGAFNNRVSLRKSRDDSEPMKLSSEMDDNEATTTDDPTKSSFIKDPQVRERLLKIRQSSIVRFGRKKDLVKHLKEVHYGHVNHLVGNVSQINNGIRSNVGELYLETSNNDDQQLDFSSNPHNNMEEDASQSGNNGSVLAQLVQESRFQEQYGTTDQHSDISNLPATATILYQPTASSTTVDENGRSNTANQSMILYPSSVADQFGDRSRKETTMLYHSSGNMGGGGNSSSFIMSNLAALNNSLGAATHRAHLDTLQQRMLMANASPDSPHPSTSTTAPLSADLLLLPIYECKPCRRSFASRVNLKRHEERIHGDPKPVHLCEFCGKVFGYARTLKDHIGIAHPTSSPMDENLERPDY
ncbi:unnamed protein product [Gordionus sp. m RMFG-2023]|uniref:uncharacterized protein LOC135931419 isoform X1 n=1 Tax=Gordionus sp. m RMFG-2023 TaxID=3053472 RepID=UPI0030E3AF9C